MSGERDSGGAAGGPQLLETPFLGYYGETESGPEEDSWSTNVWTASETPFLSEYRIGDRIVDPAAGAVRAFMADLSDESFDAALEELLVDAEAEADRLGVGEIATDSARAEHLLMRRMEPLRLEAEALLEDMAAGLDRADLDSLGETELEQLLDRYEPRDTGLEPVQEEFLGKVWKKAKRAVRGAVALAKKGAAAVARVLPSGIILRRLARLVRPLLQRVVKFALDKLPPALRPHAARLATRITGLKAEIAELEYEDALEAENAYESEGVPAAISISALQREFDTEIAALVTAGDEFEQEDLLAEATTAPEAEESDLLAELDDARSRFVDRLSGLEEGTDPTPLVEEFLPAVLPVLRLALRAIGRPKVVTFLARYLGRLIAPYVGPKITPALSQAIVDAGLRLMTLEAPVEPTPRVAAEAFANVVEDTVLRLSQLSEAELEDEFALEEAAYEGFHEAVAASFPSAVLDPASEHLETARPAGSWVAMPLGQRVRYRKYSRVYEVVITPQVAKAIRTQGGRTLHDALRGRFGPGGLRGRLHLYQAVPGSRGSRILRAEGRTRSIGSSARGASSIPPGGRVHPLTREAAGLLLGEPGLGRHVSESYLDREEPLAVGQRLYYLEVPGERAAPSRASTTTLAVDLKQRQLRVGVYIGESESQALAARLRRREPPGASLAAIRRIYRAGIRAAVNAAPPGIAVVREEPEQEEWTASALRLARFPAGMVAAALERWVGRALAVELARRREAFIEATAAEADGVTLIVRLDEVPGLGTIAPLLAGRSAASGRPPMPADLRAALRGEARSSTVDIRPGFHRA